MQAECRHYAKGWVRFLYNHNPFYVVSAVLVLYGLHVSFADNLEPTEGWLFTRLFMGYMLLLAAAAVLVVRLGRVWEDARTLAKAEATFEHMRAGVPVIEQAVLRNPQNRTYGLADLLVRSDHMNDLVPDSISAEEAAMPAPALGGQPWHYRALDVKFHTMDLLKDGHADQGVLAPGPIGALERLRGDVEVAGAGGDGAESQAVGGRGLQADRALVGGERLVELTQRLGGVPAAGMRGGIAGRVGDGEPEVIERLGERPRGQRAPARVVARTVAQPAGHDRVDGSVRAER